ncbi:MAG: thiamine phosphate synthase [Planctomycetota bacterium]
MASSTPSLCLLFTPDECRSDPWQTLARAVAGGVDLVQWRRKGDARPGSERCRALCAELGVPMVVNDDVDLAVALDAAGAHVGQDDLAPAQARARLGPTRWLGVSTHDLAQLEAAQTAGADYVGFGPCYPTATKGYAVGLGPEAAGEATRIARIPVFAIGGIDAIRARELARAGCRAIAVSAAVLTAEDPRQVAAALRAALATTA